MSITRDALEKAYEKLVQQSTRQWELNCLRFSDIEGKIPESAELIAEIGINEDDYKVRVAWNYNHETSDMEWWYKANKISILDGEFIDTSIEDWNEGGEDLLEIDEEASSSEFAENYPLKFISLEKFIELCEAITQ
jgi:hypothetical protein